MKQATTGVDKHTQELEPSIITGNTFPSLFCYRDKRGVTDTLLGKDVYLILQLCRFKGTELAMAALS